MLTTNKTALSVKANEKTVLKQQTEQPTSFGSPDMSQAVFTTCGHKQL